MRTPRVGAVEGGGIGYRCPSGSGGRPDVMTAIAAANGRSEHRPRSSARLAMPTVVLDDKAPWQLRTAPAHVCDDTLMPVTSAAAEATVASPASERQRHSRLQLSVLRTCRQHCPDAHERTAVFFGSKVRRLMPAPSYLNMTSAAGTMTCTIGADQTATSWSVADMSGLHRTGGQQSIMHHWVASPSESSVK